MKKTLVLMLMAILLLAACSPAAAPAGDPTPGEDRPGEQQEPDSGTDEDGDQSEIDWQPSPETVVISVKMYGGFVPTIFIENYIPDAQYFGDGRVIWVDFKENGSRAVLEGQLSQADLQAILERIESSGFYGWDDRYANPLVADAPDRCIEVRTLERDKSVCEYVEGAPEAFHELYDWLVRGAGASGEPFIPERGYVTSYPIEGLDAEFSANAASWQAQDGPDLAEMQSGVWLEGAALQQAWQIVNASGSGALVQQGDSYYQLSVKVPGLSLEAPPES